MHQKITSLTMKFQLLKRLSSLGRKVSLSSLLVIAAYALLSGVDTYAQGTWTPLVRTAPHFSGGVMILMTDGTVLCKSSSGGGQGTVFDKLTPDATGSYVNGTWTSIAAMHDDRLYFSSQVLPDGRLYVAGGEYGAGGPKSEVYNPVTNTWTMCPQIVFSHNISDANSEILPNGKVLQSVVDTASTRLNFLWDPATNTYSPTGSTLRTNNEAMWVKLPDSSVLFIDNYGMTSERYIPSTGTWINDATVPVNLYDPFGSEAGAAFMLPDGRAFFIGSTSTSAYYTPSGTTAPGTWAAGPSVAGMGAPDAASAMMPNGKVLEALSPIARADNHFPDSTFFYEFDYLTNTYTPVLTPVGTAFYPQACYITNMLDLPDGSVLFVQQGDNQFYEYMPGSAPLAAGKPTINNIIERRCDSFTITGTLFNGICEGAGYGDDWQMESNYPIVRLTSGTNVYYAKTTYWNRIGAVMTGALPDTAQFKIAGSVPNGTYNVQVVANGNPSANFTLHVGPAAITPASPSVCPGTTVPLTGLWGTGTWSSSNTAIATIDGVTGIATGVATGTTIITYFLGTCYSTATLTVNTSAGVINPTGAITMCAGGSINLTDATTGGTWSSSAIGVATIGSTSGTAVAAGLGVTTINYSTGSCSASTTITVIAPPAVITGIANVCPGTSSTLLDASSGGTWTSSASSIVTIGSLTGSVTGISAGTATITYNTGIGCNSTKIVTVNPLPVAITGTTTICSGITTTLSDATGGGTWSSGSTGVATIGAVSGSMSGISNGTSIITYTAATGCINTIMATINASPLPITGTFTLCAGSTTTLSDATSGGTWGSSNPGVASIGTLTGNLTTLMTGTTVITYYGTGCNATATITVNTAPGAISGVTTFCSAATTTLTDAVAGGTWSCSNTAVATVLPGSGLLTGAGTGTATITYAIGTCIATTNILVNQSPAAIIGATTQCVGFTTTLSDAVAGGTWTSSNTAVATIGAATGFMTAILAGTSMMTYDMGNGCTTTTVAMVNNLASPISGATTLCSSASTTLTDAVSGGTWSSSDITKATINTTTGVVSGVSAGAVIMTYTVGAGCYTTTGMAIISGPTTILGTTSLCPGIPSTLSNTVGGGTWSSTNTAVATIGLSTGVVSGLTFGTSIISYVLGTGCFATTMVTVAPPTGGSITGFASVCQGQSTFYSSTVSGGIWTSSNTAIATIGTGTGYITGVATGVVTISYTVSNACGIAFATKTIAINTIPAMASITGVSSICVGGVVTLTDVTPSGVWSSSNSAIASINSGGVVTGFATGAITISYSLTNTFGCTTTAFLPFTVALPIAASISASGPTTFCTGGNVLLTATAGTGLSYQWQIGGVNISGATTIGYFVTTLSGNYDVVVNSGVGCNSTSSPINVTVNPTHIIVPTVSISATPGNTLCVVSSPVTFSASPVGGGTLPVYDWFVNGSYVASGVNYTYPTPANGDIVKCRLTSNDVCAFPDTAVNTMPITISPLQSPSVSINGDPGHIVCKGGNDIFTAVPAFGGSAPIYLWTLNGINVATGPIYEIYAPLTGGIVKCFMTSNYPCLVTNTATSSPYSFSVNNPVTNVVTMKATHVSILNGQTDTFMVTTTHGGSAPAFQWYINGLAVPGATDAMYITTGLLNGQVVNCEVTSNELCVTNPVVFTGGITVNVGVNGISPISSKDGLTLAPNPNNGQFTISGILKNWTSEKTLITVTNLLGQVVYSSYLKVDNGAINENVILNPNLSNGIYLVNITGVSDKTVFHIAIER